MHKLYQIALLTLVTTVLIATPLRAEKVTLGKFVKEQGTAGFEDTYTKDEAGPLGSEETLSVGLWGGKALIRFDVSALAGKEITSAKLTLFCHWHPAEDREVSAHAVLVPWVEAEATWNEYANGRAWEKANAAGAKDRRSKPADTFAIPGKTKRVSSCVWDVTSLVKEWVAGTLPNNGVVLEWKGQHGSPIVYRSSEHKGYKCMRLDVEYEGALSQMGLDPTFFATSNSLLDKTSRERAALAEKSGAAKDIAALKAIINIKQFTLRHAELAIQQYFSADALAGLDRALTYAGRTGTRDAALRRYKALVKRHGAAADGLAKISEEYGKVFPFVVQPPKNRPANDMEYFRERYKGRTDFASATGEMLSRAKDLLATAQAVETLAREQLLALGAGAGADWAPGSALRTRTSSRREPAVTNYDDSGKPTHIIVGNAYGGQSQGPANIDLLEKLTFDYIPQQYTFNRLDETGEVKGRTGRYGRHSLPGEIIQPCSNHSGTMFCELPLYRRFEKEGRLNDLFAGPGYGGFRSDKRYVDEDGNIIVYNSSLVPVDWTLPEVWEFQREYLMKLGAVYADRQDISYVKVSWEPTNSWGSQVDPAMPETGKFWTEGGHTVSGIAAFHKRMKEKFGSIEKLNEAWKSSYGSFDDIDVSAFRKVKPRERQRATALFYEWQTHRQAMMAEWWQFCSDALREGGLTRPVAVEVPVSASVQTRHALHPYVLAKAGDLLQSHQGYTPTERDVLLESLGHYYPDKSLGSGEYSWNEPEAWSGATEEVVGAAGERNLWRCVARGQTIFGIYGAMDTYAPYPGWHPNSGNNMLDYFTDYTMIRRATGALQLAHVKLDALKDVWLETRPVSRKLAVYWPTASMINARPLDIHVRNGGRYAGGIMPTIHDMLFDRGYAYRYAFEEAVLDGKEDFSEISVLILPYAAWLPAEVGERLTAWVKAGGTLISAGPFGAETVYGFKDGSAMRTIFGEVFAMEPAEGIDWIVSGRSEHANADIVAVTFGKGKVLVTSSGFGLFSGEGNRRFWQALDSGVTRDAWCTDAGGTREPKMDLVLREDRDGLRYLSVTNENAFGPVDVTLGMKGKYHEIVDLGVCGSVSVRPSVEGPNSYVRLRLRAGEGTVFKLGKLSDMPADTDTESMRAEVVRLDALGDKAVPDVGSLDRVGLARQYNELLDHKPLIHFEPVSPGEVIVSAPLDKDMKLAATDGENAHLTAPDMVYGAARIDRGALVLDQPASGISYIGEGLEGETWGGSLGSIAGKPFTVKLDYKAKDSESVGTLMDIWYGESYAHFRVRLLTRGRLQVHQIIRHWGDGTQRVLTTKELGLTDGKWHRIAVTVPNVEDEAQGGIEFHVDGELVCRESDPDTHGEEYVLNHVQPNLPTGNPGLPVISSWIYNWSVGCRQFTTTRHLNVYRDPSELDTALGRYRDLVVTQGINPPGE